MPTNPILDRTPPPNPGSIEAIAIGCTCPILDNGHGAGAWGGMKRDGQLMFWISDGCPLHSQNSIDDEIQVPKEEQAP